MILIVALGCASRRGQGQKPARRREREEAGDSNSNNTDKNDSNNNDDNSNETTNNTNTTNTNNTNNTNTTSNTNNREAGGFEDVHASHAGEPQDALARNKRKINNQQQWE